jgi:hypothetical protein
VVQDREYLAEGAQSSETRRRELVDEVREGERRIEPQ